MPTGSLVWISVLLLFLCGAPAHAQAPAGASLDSLLKAHMHPMSLKGTRASGPGFDVLVESASTAQFFIIAEEHNLRELNELSVALFDELQAKYGVHHLVLEQGEIIASWIDAAARDGGRDSVNALVRRYPHAPTFATDEELELMVHVRQASPSPEQAVWGVDQELAAMHLLERLAELTESPEARTEMLRLADEARPHEETRTGDVHYLYSVANPDEYAALSGLTDPPEDSEERRVLDALQRTVRIYSARQDPDGVYAGNLEREQSMRARFMELYRAVSPNSEPPRALVKMGHWHTLRGFYRADVLTFGNFLSELAASNDMTSVVAATYVVDSPDAWRNSGGVVARVADPDGIIVVDLRPLRPVAHRDGIADLGGAWRDLIFQADFLIIVGGGQTGSYRTAHGTEGR